MLAKSIASRSSSVAARQSSIVAARLSSSKAAVAAATKTSTKPKAQRTLSLPETAPMPQCTGSVEQCPRKATDAEVVDQVAEARLLDSPFKEQEWSVRRRV